MCRIVFTIVALGLAACTPDDSYQSEKTVISEPVNAITSPAPEGEVELVVSTETQSGQIISGAVCNTRTSRDQATLTTPGRVLMPHYGSATPQVLIDCRAAGATGSLVLRPEIRSEGSWGGFPSVGVSVNSGGDIGLGLGWYGSGTRANGQYVRYPEATVILK